jgi:hypothetical protein
MRDTKRTQQTKRFRTGEIKLEIFSFFLASPGKEFEARDVLWFLREKYRIKRRSRVYEHIKELLNNKILARNRYGKYSISPDYKKEEFWKRVIDMFDFKDPELWDKLINLAYSVGENIGLFVIKNSWRKRYEPLYKKEGLEELLTASSEEFPNVVERLLPRIRKSLGESINREVFTYLALFEAIIREYNILKTIEEIIYFLNNRKKQLSKILHANTLIYSHLTRRTLKALLSQEKTIFDYLEKYPVPKRKRYLALETIKNVRKILENNGILEEKMATIKPVSEEELKKVIEFLKSIERESS